MEKKHIIILAIIVVIVALLVGIFATMPNAPNKESTNLTFKCKSTINEGDSIKIQLTDSNGTAIANQSVNVTITDKNNASDYHSVTTNAKGVGTLNIDKKAGNYIITIKYGGNDNYSGCNATKKIKIGETVVEEETTSSNEQNNNGESSTGSTSKGESDGYWETSIDAPFEYHTEYDSSGGFRQYDKSGNLVGSSYDEDQDKIADYVPRRI